MQSWGFPVGMSRLHGYLGIDRFYRYVVITFPYVNISFIIKKHTQNSTVTIPIPLSKKRYIKTASVFASRCYKWCSQNTEKITHIKGRLLYQAFILYNYAPFRIKERFCSQRERILSFKSSSLRYGKSLTKLGELP